MKHYMRNPISSEVLTVSAREARSLAAYGWTRADKAEFDTYHKAKASAQVEYATRKFVTGLRVN